MKKIVNCQLSIVNYQLFPAVHSQFSTLNSQLIPYLHLSMLRILNKTCLTIFILFAVLQETQAQEFPQLNFENEQPGIIDN